MQELDLSSCEIGSVRAQALGSELRPYAKLDTLDLSAKPIGEGVRSHWLWAFAGIVR